MLALSTLRSSQRPTDSLIGLDRTHNGRQLAFFARPLGAGLKVVGTLYQQGVKLVANGRRYGCGNDDDAVTVSLDQSTPTFGHSQAAAATATSIPTSCATMKASTPAGAIPAKVSDRERAMVTAGLANDVDAVNQ